MPHGPLGSLWKRLRIVVSNVSRRAHRCASGLVASAWRDRRISRHAEIAHVAVPRPGLAHGVGHQRRRVGGANRGLWSLSLVADLRRTSLPSLEILHKLAIEG